MWLIDCLALKKCLCVCEVKKEANEGTRQFISTWNLLYRCVRAPRERVVLVPKLVELRYRRLAVSKNLDKGLFVMAAMVKEARSSLCVVEAVFVL